MTNLFNANLTNVLMIALIGAVGYYAISKISTNAIVPIAIGLAMLFIGRGGLFSLAGGAIATVGISRFISQKVVQVTSERSG